MVPYFDPVPIEVAAGYGLAARHQSRELFEFTIGEGDWPGHFDHAAAVCPAFERSED